MQYNVVFYVYYFVQKWKFNIEIPYILNAVVCSSAIKPTPYVAYIMSDIIYSLPSLMTISPAIHFVSCLFYIFYYF